MAPGVLLQAQLQGIRVPEAMAVVGFGGLDLAAHTIPAPTTVEIKSIAIGQQAADFIVRRAQEQPIDPRIVDIGFHIVERDRT